MQVNKCGRPWMGPWLFGVSLDVLLFGILTVQIYMYYLGFPKDRRLLKLAVIWLYLVGTAQTILAIVDLYTAFSDPLPLVGVEEPGMCDVLAVSFKSRVCLTVIAPSASVALTTQWLYAYRIHVISRKIWILILIICLSLAQLGSSIVGCTCIWSTPAIAVPIFEFDDNNPCQGGFIWVWGPLNFLCNATITVSMSILLLNRRKETIKKTTHACITKVIWLVVETGLATSIVVVVYTVTYDLVSVVQDPWAMVTAWLIPGLAMGKVYSNSMLALLNSCLTIIGGRNAGDPFSISEIRSEVLRTEVEEDQSTIVATRRKAPWANEEDSVPT